MKTCSQSVLLQGVHITLRMRLVCEVWRLEATCPEQTHEVMNEVVVDRGSNPFLTKIECWERGRLITKVPSNVHAQISVPFFIDSSDILSICLHS